MKHVTGFFCVLVLFFVVITVITVMFIGTGSIISYFFDLSLFNSALLCISSTFVLSFFVFIMDRFIANKQEEEDSLDELEDRLDDLEKLFYNRQPSKFVFDLPKKPRNKK